MLKFNFTVPAIKIKSDWFEECKRKKSVFDKIGFKGLNLYFQMFKFRLHNQDQENVFVTSIELLRKVSGYKTQEVFDLLKKLKSAKVINMENLSRWDYLIDNDGKIKVNDTLIITSADAVPMTTKENDEKYIFVDFTLFDLYKEKGFNERYYPLYCLIKKWSSNKEHKSWMSIKKMAKILGYDKNTVHRMIYRMNSEYLLCTVRKKSDNRNGYYFEHYILDSAKKYEKFKNKFKDKCDKLIKSNVNINEFFDE